MFVFRKLCASLKLVFFMNKVLSLKYHEVQLHYFCLSNTVDVHLSNLVLDEVGSIAQLSTKDYKS